MCTRVGKGDSFAMDVNGTSGVDHDVTFESLNTAEVTRQIPLIIYLVLVGCSGTLGNILVWFVYKTKYGPSNCRTFLLFLSSIDLFTCVLGIPFEIAFVTRQYDFRNVAACKISVLLNTWPTLTSGFVLLAIAVDRYRKVCRPFSWQISLRYAGGICAVCVLAAALFSCLSPVIYGLERLPHPGYPNITVSQCVVTDHMNKHTVLPLLNNVFFAVLFVGALVAMSVMYCFIGAGVRAHARRRENMRYSRPKSSTIADTSDASELTIRSGMVAMKGGVRESTKRKDDTSDALFCSESSESRREESQISTLDQEPSVPILHSIDSQHPDLNSPTSGRPSVFGRMLSVGRYSMHFLTRTHSRSASLERTAIRRESRDRKSRSEHDKARRSAFIMFLISLAFVLSYLPLLCILLIRSIDTGFVARLGDAGRTAYKFFLRSYYLNCTINPVIYGLWDAKFRKAAKRVLFLCRRRR